MEEQKRRSRRNPTRRRAPSRSGEERNADGWNSEGDELLRRGDLLGAKAAYDRAIALDPENQLAARLSRCRAYISLGCPYYAVGDADVLLATGQQSAVSVLGLRARSYLAMPGPMAAYLGAQDLLRASALAPDDAAIRMELEKAGERVRAEARKPSKKGQWIPFRPRLLGAPDISLSGNKVTREFFSACAPTLVRVKDVRGMGRGMFASERIPRGTAIFEEEPIVSVNVCEGGCDFCFRALPEASARDLRCGDCGAVWCSKRCSDSAALLHPTICAYKRSLDDLARQFTECDTTNHGKNLLLVARLMAMAIATGSRATPLELPVLAHMHCRPHRKLKLLHVQAIVEDLRGRFGLAHNSWLSTEWYVLASSLIEQNAFNFLTRPDRPFPALCGGGLGLFPLAAIANHSCAPNAVYVFDCASGGHSLRLVAIEDIAEGEQIFDAYFDPTLPEYDDPAARRKRLRTYGFECRCARCTRGGQG